MNSSGVPAPFLPRQKRDGLVEGYLEWDCSFDATETEALMGGVT